MNETCGIPYETEYTRIARLFLGLFFRDSFVYNVMLHVLAVLGPHSMKKICNIRHHHPHH